MYRRNIFLATAAFPLAALAQLSPTSVILDSPFQVRYASNMNVGDSVINIINTGARGAGLAYGTSAAITGAICVSVYAFSPDEQMMSCCSCPLTPNGLIFLSARQDLINNIGLTPAFPTAIVIKLLATVPVGGNCRLSAMAPGALTSGLVAWGTTVHAAPGGVYAITETPFIPVTLSEGELARLTGICTFLYANGSGFGVCRSCRVGGL
jgi:hypothetical protein